MRARPACFIKVKLAIILCQIEYLIAGSVIRTRSAFLNGSWSPAAYLVETRRSVEHRTRALMALS